MQRTIVPTSQTARLLIWLSLGVILLTAATNWSSGSLIANAEQDLTPKNLTMNPYSGSGQLILSDSLQKATAVWPIDSNCQFITGGYQLTANGGTVEECHYTKLQPSNLTLEAQMSITKGDNQQSCAGLVLRNTTSAGQAYVFAVTPSGSYEFIRYDGFNHNGGAPTVLQIGTTSAMHTGLQQPNLIAANVKASKLDFYINHKNILSKNDATYTQGQFGFFSGCNQAAVIFTNAKVCQL